MTCQLSEIRIWGVTWEGRRLLLPLHLHPFVSLENVCAPGCLQYRYFEAEGTKFCQVFLGPKYLFPNQLSPSVSKCQAITVVILPVLVTQLPLTKIVFKSEPLSTNTNSLACEGGTRERKACQTAQHKASWDKMHIRATRVPAHP